MKLKKIASLMLAGIMAVSMLAGCSNGNSNSGNNGGETNTATGVAAAFNDAQIAGNKVKIEFANDSAFDSYLAEAVKRAGQGAEEQDVIEQFILISGIYSNTQAFADDTTSNDDLENGMEKTMLSVRKVESDEALNEAAAIKVVANDLNTFAANLKASNYDKNTMGAGSTYYEYNYTGKVSVVSVVNNDGTTDYYFAVVVTQTITETKK